MPLFNEASMAWALTRAMARVVDVNLVEAVAEGWLDREELATLVEGCAGCRLSYQCTGWLAVTPKAEALPVYCRIKAGIEALKP